jgi:hypothetical protein
MVDKVMNKISAPKNRLFLWVEHRKQPLFKGVMVFNGPVNPCSNQNWCSTTTINPRRRSRGTDYSYVQFLVRIRSCLETEGLLRACHPMPSRALDSFDRRTSSELRVGNLKDYPDTYKPLRDVLWDLDIMSKNIVIIGGHGKVIKTELWLNDNLTAHCPFRSPSD